MTSIRLSALLLTGAALAAPASAQDFNAAPPNAADQQPAFEGQTRAPVLEDEVTLDRAVVVDGLEHPWGMEQLPDGRWLVTERPGRLRIVTPGGEVSDPVEGLPQVDARRQGGLLDVQVRDDFDETRRVWWSYAEPREGGETGTAVATGLLSEDGSAMEEVEVIFRQMPGWASSMHYGSRLVFDGSGALFVTTGERSLPEPRQLAQDPSTHLGKVLRIDPMGGAMPGNPQIEGGAPEVWSLGHRNIQAAALGPNGALWTIEHGPRGGDELNRPEPGGNYGWPVITYGIDYNGSPIGNGETASPEMQQPLYYWDPVIAPSGMDFYEGEMFPDWQDSILVGALAGQALVRLELDGTSVKGEARYLQGQGRVRDVDVAADGAVMILTDAGNGALVRLTPSE
ncbi:PQQ-dependent sugar dehydrogenase [Pseudooceanicola marinus]|uniref:PQQ-dependent sugar dehydrogenase n=1 Tax=Pseudooceanicola marinus TaxID=396013 RepID=UPI001CD7A90F|nr:PQQ-dependent sugar dehydrogenase [Pseudooceanicola marinus]MCA1335375.1 PQQ-dependent sugar dehydrogenase [Pseudooceanicola marinus]